MTLDAQDQAVQTLGGAAVVTFHLTNPVYGRRTFVMQRTDETWQIVHLHASNLPASS